MTKKRKKNCGDECECDYCKGSAIHGIHLPTDYDDREPSRDGKVFVAKCDECDIYASDTVAARVVALMTGWKILKSYDETDALEAGERKRAKGMKWHRPYFAITLAEADAVHRL